jgi:hypothetical protein
MKRIAFVAAAVCAAAATTPRRASGQAQADSATVAASPWWSNITFGADFRARIEGFQQEESPDRLRSRLRLRVSAATAINNQLDVGVRVVTGNPADPITANQTFTDWSTRKPVTLDRAFVVYHPTSIPALRLGAGKFEAPVRITNQILDDNLSWEGAYEQLSSPGKKPVTFSFTAVQSPMNERSSAKDSYLFVESAHVGIDQPRYKLGLTASSLAFNNPHPLAEAITEERLDARNTNRVNASGTEFLSGFNLVDLIADVVLMTGRKDYPVSLTADFVRNLDAAGGDDNGVWLETQYGSAEALKTWALGYTFSRIEEEAVLSPFLFDDMLGTNATMHLATASYVPFRNTNVDLTFIFGKWINPRPDYNPNTLKRVQLSVRAHL